jgi:ectoine hydroxylase-related dioxygenase (phytanoyl-CoA dioxygenase family)
VDCWTANKLSTSWNYGAAKMNLKSLADRVANVVRQNGFCVVPSLLSSERVERLRAEIDVLLRREAKHENDNLGHQRVLHIAAKSDAFVELLSHPVCMAIYSKLLGSDFVCSTWTSNTAFQDSDLTYWHVDHPYWTIASPYPVDYPLTAHAIWCLDDFSEKSGGTKMIPGSHLRTHLPEHKGNYEQEGVTVEASAGSLIVAHGAIWHSAGRNSSASTRTGIFGRYARSFIIPQEDLRRQLDGIADPDSLIERLMGKHQYVPQRTLPY